MRHSQFDMIPCQFDMKLNICDMKLYCCDTKLELSDMKLGFSDMKLVLSDIKSGFSDMLIFHDISTQDNTHRFSRVYSSELFHVYMRNSFLYSASSPP